MSSFKMVGGFRRCGHALLVASVGALALLASACGLLEKRAELRYKMTVTLERDGRVYSAQGVQEIKAVAIKRLTAEHISGAARVNGESIAVELPTGPIFVSLRTRIGGLDLHSAVLRAFNRSEVPSAAPEYIAALRKISRRGGRAILAPEDWPLCIELRSADDPKGARFMTAAQAGVREIAVEVTDEAITTRLNDRFPWLKVFSRERVSEPDLRQVQTEFDPASGSKVAYFTREDLIFNPTDKVEEQLWESRRKLWEADLQESLREAHRGQNAN